MRYMFWFHNLSAILLSINPLVASGALWNSFLKVVFRESSPVLVAGPNNCFPNLSDRFLTNDKNRI